MDFLPNACGWSPLFVTDWPHHLRTDKVAHFCLFPFLQQYLAHCFPGTYWQLKERLLAVQQSIGRSMRA